MTSVLVVSPEPVRARMAGMGIRALKIAETARAEGHEVALAAPSGVEDGIATGIPGLDSAARGFGQRVQRFAVAIASGHSGDRLAAAGFDGILVGDLYDPFLVENFAYHETLGAEVFERDRRTFFHLLARADLLLAASEAQRLFYLGLLLGRGLLGPSDLAGDADARRLVETAPFGVDETDPGPPRPSELIGPGQHDVLFGGVYDWYDPELVLDAWGGVLKRVPTARLLFAESPNPASTPQRALARSTERARREGWLGSSIHVLPWTPYPERGGLYRSCRVAVLAHRPSIEARLSFRTRVLDYLWAGLPTVATGEGGASELLLSSGAGLAVPPRQEALAEALIAVLLDDELRGRLSAGARSAAATLRWSLTLAPLLRFLASPRRRERTSRIATWARGVAKRAVRPR